MIRLAPVTDETDEARLTLTGSHDLRANRFELRANLALKASPNGWGAGAPQAATLWRGAPRALERSYDAAALTNAISQRALQREIERVEMLEADIRERAMFNRRLRAERERRAAEERAAAEAAQAEARRLAEERARAQAEAANAVGAPDSVPPLPPPVQISPLPALQIGPPRLN